MEGGEFGGQDYLYCRYLLTYGSDWEVIGGIDSGLSQTACLNPVALSDRLVWNLPIDVTLKSSNVSGWPRLALSVFSMDLFGRDIVQGYASLLLPLQPGQHRLEVPVFRPIANSSLNALFAWASGNPPEFFDSRFVCQGEGREVSRVVACGSLALTLHITLKGKTTTL